MELVSIIMPAYNREATIKRSIESIIAQTYSNWELIVVNDKSTDDTVKIVDSFGDDRIRIINNKHNLGACVSRNIGIEAARGEYIAFLDSDDTWIPERIEGNIEIVKQNSYDITFARFKIDGKDFPFHGYVYGEEKITESMLYCNFVTTGTLFGGAEVFKTIRFDEEMPRFQDWDIALRISEKYKFGFWDECILFQFPQKNSITTITSGEKTVYALKRIYDKNIAYLNSIDSLRAHFAWVLAINELKAGYVDKDRFIEAKDYGKNLKYLVGYGMIQLKLSNLLKRIY